MLAAISLLALLSMGWSFLRPLVWLCDVLALGLLFVDWRRTPVVSGFEVTRSLPEHAGLSRPIARQVQLSMPSAAGLEVELYESYPGAFVLESITQAGRAVRLDAGQEGHAFDSGRLDARGFLELQRHYRSDVRGVFELGSVRLRLGSPWGLWKRQARFDASLAVAVQPALAGLRQTLRLAASERWQDLGVRHMQRRGGETEFESLREYVPGDDVRRIDWKAFARRGKPMIRQYQVERGQELILLIDVGRRMRIATAEGHGSGWSKLDWALDAALQLAAVALSKGDRVGAAAYSNGLDVWVAPMRGRQQQTRLAQALFSLQPIQGDANLTQALLELSLRHRRRATVVILSDVADPLSAHAQRRALASASKRHKLIFAALDDPGLRQLVELQPDAHDAVAAPLRAAAFELIEDRRQALRSLASSGARVLDALPATAAAPLLAAWLAERRR